MVVLGTAKRQRGAPADTWIDATTPTTLVAVKRSFSVTLAVALLPSACAPSSPRPPPPPALSVPADDVCSPTTELLDRAPTASGDGYRFERVGESVALVLVLHRVVRVRAELPLALLRGTAGRCIDASAAGVTGFVGYLTPGTLSFDDLFDITALRFLELDATAVERNAASMTLELYVRRRAEPRDTRRLVLRELASSIGHPPEDPSDGANQHALATR